MVCRKSNQNISFNQFYIFGCFQLLATMFKLLVILFIIKKQYDLNGYAHLKKNTISKPELTSFDYCNKNELTGLITKFLDSFLWFGTTDFEISFTLKS